MRQTTGKLKYAIALKSPHLGWHLHLHHGHGDLVAELRDGNLATHLCLSSPSAPSMQVTEESAILASQLHQMIIEPIIIPGPHFLCHEAKQK